MDTQVQYIIAGLMVMGAVFYVIRHIYKSTRGKSCEAGACGCSKVSTTKTTTHAH